jgi:hypothetical protein
LPEAREIDTRRRLFHLFPEAREFRPKSACPFRGLYRDLSLSLTHYCRWVRCERPLCATSGLHN